MIDTIRCAYPYALMAALVLLLLAMLWQLKRRSGLFYRYPLAAACKQAGMSASGWITWLPFGLRTLLLGILAFVVGRPQWIERRTQVEVEGVAIMLVLDVSGSMQAFDDMQHPESRLAVAKREAITFVRKRHNDAIGLVIFGQTCLSRCPLTLDKTLLCDIIRELEVGIIEARGTMLAAALVTAANRLKSSKAASKIIVMLTDGSPSPEDIKPELALEIVQKLGIKVYTIATGVGQGYGHHPIFGVQAVASSVNKPLLKKIAQSTGGQFFEASSAEDMERIYSTIDELEKTAYETEIFTAYDDFFEPLLWIAFMLVCMELLGAAYIWFGVYS